MLGLFRLNQPFAILPLLLLVAILMLRSFLYPMAEIDISTGVLSGTLFPYLPDSRELLLVISGFLILVQALLINAIVNRNRITKEATYFPALFYVILTAGFHFYHGALHLLAAQTFVLLGVIELFSLYKHKNPETTIFNVGLCFAIASLFFGPIVGYLLFGMIGLGVLRAYNFREMIVFLLGFLTVFFLTFMLYFWVSDIPTFFQEVAQPFALLDFQFGPHWLDWTPLAVCGFILIIAILNFGSFSFKTSIQVQKYISLLFWLALFPGLVALFTRDAQAEHLILLSPSLSVFLTFLFLSMRRTAIAEFLAILLLTILLTVQYINHVF